MIETSHLKLTPFLPGHFLALIEGGSSFEDRFGLRLADGVLEYYVSDEVSPDWLEMLRKAKDADPWVYGFAIFHREDDLVIGTVGFKGPPDEDGMVEIAYGIAPGYQKRGYATEAAEAGVTYAFKHPEVCLVRAHTMPNPNASTRVLSKCGFKFIGDVIDPEDGVVWRWGLNRGAKIID
jgi:ribosomal-protein-alanine N-acetyltransferase